MWSLLLESVYIFPWVTLLEFSFLFVLGPSTFLFQQTSRSVVLCRKLTGNYSTYTDLVSHKLCSTRLQFNKVVIINLQR